MIRPLHIVSLGLAALAVSCGDSSSPTPSGSKPENNAAAKPDEAAKPAEKPSSGVKIDASMVKTLFGEDPPKAGRNRVTAAKVALGGKLYHEKRLSKEGDISCATCHDLNNFGQDGKATSPGTGGAAGKRNTPTTFNAYRQFAQFWDWRAGTVEEQSTMPILTDVEHGLKDEAQIEEILRGIPEYEDLFKKAFPKDDPAITADNVRQAIGAFERKLKTRSRWDAFVEGDEAALTDDEKRGLQAFMAATCTTCHMTRMMGGSMPQKLGLVKPVESADTGRAEFTGKDGDKFMFKVPSLLNVAKTGPYYHDGSIADLEEAVRHMAQHQTAIPVSDGQIKSIVTFLGALTGELEDPSVLELK